MLKFLPPLVSVKCIDVLKFTLICIESTHSATIILIVIMAILFGLIGLLTYIYFCQKYHVFNDSTTNKSPGLIKESWNPNWRQNKVSLTKKKHKAADYLPASLNRTTTKWSSLKTGKESKQSNETKQNQTDSAAASNAFTGKDSKQKSSKKKRTWRRITSRKASSRRKDSSRKGSKGVATKRSSAKRVDAFTTKAVKLMLKKDKANSKLKKSKGHGSQFKKLKTKLLKNSSRQRTKTERG